MLLFSLPLLYLDGVLKVYQASLSMWRPKKSEPVIIMLEDEPPPVAAEAS
jgi:hypothetical protein